MSDCKPNSCCAGCSDCGLTRRGLLSGAGALLAGAAFRGVALGKDPDRQMPIKQTLRVQPVLAYEIPKRREAGSWRNWGGLQTEADVAQEKERIGGELKQLKAEFPLEILPLAAVSTPEQAAAVAGQAGSDVVLNYAAGGFTQMMEALTPANKWNLMFLRHRSGPAYLWYEIAHNRYLRKTVDEFGQPGMTVDDVVVDQTSEIEWRLRALYGLKNTLGKRVVAVGGASGWGDGGRNAPERAKELWKLDIQNLPYTELGERIRRARADQSLVKRCHADAERYLAQKGITLETKRQFVLNAFVLTEVFRQLLDEARTDAMTINQCMGTIMPMSETTACLPLSLLNDDGYMAFCESDFVVIPAGILLHYIGGKPVFLNDPTYPHDGLVTLAHCTAPRKMDGANPENTRILTHFESDYGAAPKVEMKLGQRLTNLIPDFASKKWVGFEGEVVDNPFLPICRSQVDVKILGSTHRLLEEHRGFHWMTGYGSYLRESGYALNKSGVEWVNLTA